MHDSVRKRESVWDYPRPPRIEPSSRTILVVYNGITVAETNQALRMLETSHPPVYYIPPGDVRTDYLVPSRHHSFCEYKGVATYYNLTVQERISYDAAWCYPDPSNGYGLVKNYLAFYPKRVDACYVDGEKVRFQDGDFYGGWITSEIQGPYKGGSGTLGW